MTLTWERDLAAADWIARSDLPWWRLVTLGPAGFGAYGRLRLLPDPTRPGQSENDAEAEDWRSAQVPVLWEPLAGATATPEDCWFCVWEGFGAAAALVARLVADPRLDVVATDPEVEPPAYR
ncbi:MAG TPA: hypothetical protein VES95_13160 [Dermatophilaceae bacterium]|nr:hypothetical protein [Dermatophilaceae bacterium]